MILLDTHVLLWTVTENAMLGRRSRRMIERHWARGEVAACALTFWEAALLQDRGRIELSLPAAQWRTERITSGLVEIAVDGAIAIRAAGLGGLPGDPIDRLIVATTLERRALLLTADAALLGWSHPLERHDARL